ncbi:sugar phosphate isomerase/epimerase family protein [Plantactinospora siamensis]|uniref:Sugar phosphate isomerase/epimerase family protein n=1 Tax=Plantactinospora siamensis TaxID=555372 RepID=A0ABV6P5B7_9ACTN
MTTGLRYGLLVVEGTVSDAIRVAGDHDFHGVELAIRDSVEDLTDRALQEWQRMCADRGLHLAAHAPSIDLKLDSLNPGIRRESIDQITRCIRRLGPAIEYLTIHTGHVRRFSKLGSLERVTAALIDLATLAAETSLTICVENVFEGSIDELLDYVELANQPNLKLTFDVSHAVAYGGFDPLAALDVLEDVIVNVHLSDNDGTGNDQHLPLGLGVVPVQQVIDRLTSSGFPGFVTVEAVNVQQAGVSADYLHRLGHLAGSGNR